MDPLSINFEKLISQGEIEPTEIRAVFDLKPTDVNVLVNQKLEAIASPVVVLDGTAAVTMASSGAFATSEGLDKLKETNEVPRLGVSRKAANFFFNPPEPTVDENGNVIPPEEIEILQQPPVPPSVLDGPSLSILADGGFGFERDTLASRLVNQSSAVLVPRTMMTDLDVRHRGNVFGIPKVPRPQGHHLIQTSRGSSIDGVVWKAATTAIMSGLQVYALRHEQNLLPDVEFAVSCYLSLHIYFATLRHSLNLGEPIVIGESVNIEIEEIETDGDGEETAADQIVLGWPCKLSSEGSITTVSLENGRTFRITLAAQGKSSKTTEYKEYYRWTQKVWNAVASAAGDEFMALLYQGNRAIMKQFMRAAISKYQVENRSTLFISWRSPGATMTTDIGVTRDGSYSIIEKSSAGFEHSYDDIAAELSEELQLSFEFINQACQAISHRTSDAIGSNSYASYNDVVILGEPWKPAIAVVSDKSWQGEQLSSRTDMVAALLQSIGRGVVRQGSASSPRLQQVFLYDIEPEILDEIDDYFSLVTHKVRGLEGVAKRYDELLRSLLSFLLDRLSEANDDFVVACRFLTKFSDARMSQRVIVSADDVTDFDYDLEKMSKHVRQFSKDFPEITVTDDMSLVNLTPHDDPELKDVWTAVMRHTVVKSLWAFRHVRHLFGQDVDLLEKALTSST